MKKRDWYVLGGIAAGAALFIGVAVAISKNSKPPIKLEPAPPGKTLQGGRGGAPGVAPHSGRGGAPAPAPPAPPRPGIPGPAPNNPRGGAPGTPSGGGYEPSNTYIPPGQRAIHPVFT